MDILLAHLEKTSEHMSPALREDFVCSFFATAPDDWTEQVFDLAYGQDLVLEKASRILSRQDFITPMGADMTSGVVRGKLRRVYDPNEGFLATLAGYYGSKIELSFDVEVMAPEKIRPRICLRVSRRLVTWTEDFVRDLREELYSIQASYSEAHEVEDDIVLGPGESLTTAFKHSLLDFSGCATLKEVDGLVKRQGDDKVLPLGVYAFDPKPALAAPESLLYVSKFGEKPMEFNGTLVVAPQNSGKTKLIMRWALAANQGGYNLFIIDVKGNLLPQLQKIGLQGDVHFFSTDPDADDEPSRRGSRFNILEELNPCTPRGRSEIRTLCEAILPNHGGEDQKYWPIRVKWLTALISLRKLFDLHYRRISDLGDVYELATTESRLYGCIADVRNAESYQKRVNPNVTLPLPTSEFWVNELAALIQQDHREIKGGQREPQYTYATLTIHLGTALAPFYRYGALHARTSGKGEFRLSDLDSDKQTTIILAAREHDGEDAQTVSAMVLKRLEQILKRRFSVDQPARNILLLLDETRRIRGFSPGKYVTFAREAKAGCVLVYQSIDQIESNKEIDEVLENIGIQIYLRSVSGATGDRLVALLPKRFRPHYTRSFSSGAGFSKTSQVHLEEVPCLAKSELYKLPAGAYPALVFIRDFNNGRPFLVDMSEKRMQRVKAKR